MTEAIKLAIEKGGYEIPDHVPRRSDWWQELHYCYMVNDPLFWQALGKALGWNNQYVIKKFAHQYFDLVLTDGDTENFWKDLMAERI